MDARPDKDWRVVLNCNRITEHKKGIYYTEQFTVGENWRLSWIASQNKRGIFRSKLCAIKIRQPGNGKLAKHALVGIGAKVKLRGSNEGHAIGHTGGTYYLEIRWGSLIRKWDVTVEQRK